MGKLVGMNDDELPVALRHCEYCNANSDARLFRGNKCGACMKEYARLYYIRVDAAKKKAKYDANPEAKIAYQKQYYIDNREKVEEYRQAYYQENREEIIADQLRRDAQRKPEIAAYQKVYRQENKDYLREQKNERDKDNPVVKIRETVSNSVRQALRAVGSTKEGNSTFKILGYPPRLLKEHIESQFSNPENLTPEGEVWMSWENWGSYDPKTWVDDDYSTHTWNIDHIVPQSEFAITSIYDQSLKDCWSLENLRPYCANKNVYDGSGRVRHTKRMK